MADYNSVATGASKLSFKIVLFVVVAVVALIIFAVWWNVSHIAAIDTYEECAAKYPVLDSYPPKCRTPDGRIFTGPGTP